MIAPEEKDQLVLANGNSPVDDPAANTEVEDDEEEEEEDEEPTEEKEDDEEAATKLVVDQAKEAQSEQQEEMVAALTEDIYSFFYISTFKSQAFWFALAVYTFQSALVWLVLVDQLQQGTATNRLAVPHGVNPEVTAAQALALVLAVATQNDLLTALRFLYEGHDPLIRDEFLSATFERFCFSFLTQLSIGTVMLLVIFILVMQASTVIDVFLDFAALAFLTEVDNVAFSLAKRGFISEELEKACDKVKQYKVPADRVGSAYCFRRGAFCMVCAGLYIGYGIIVHKQLSGDFLCRNIYVQFGDNFFYELGTFSGIYERQSGYSFGRRVAYIEQRSGKAMIAYCESENAWTFTFWENEDENPLLYKVLQESSSCDQIVANPCDWWAKSSPTVTYDVTTLSSGWLVKDSSDFQRVRPFYSFTLMCADCQGNHDMCVLEYGVCGDDNLCHCMPGRFGSTCQFEDPCPEVALDARKQQRVQLETLQFPRQYVNTVPERFVLLKDEENNRTAEAYNRTIYVDDQASPEVFLLFTGRRWEIGGESQGSPAQGLLKHVLNDTFHGFYSNEYFSPWLASEPVDYGSPKDIMTPIDLEWFKIRENTIWSLIANQVAESQQVEMAFICARCDQFNLCLNGQECQDDGVCDCYENAYEGALCEKALSCRELEARGGACQNGGVCNSTGPCECGSEGTALFFGAACELTSEYEPT